MQEFHEQTKPQDRELTARLAAQFTNDVRGQSARGWGAGCLVAAFGVIGFLVFINTLGSMVFTKHYNAHHGLNWHRYLLYLLTDDPVGALLVGFAGLVLTICVKGFYAGAEIRRLSNILIAQDDVQVVGALIDALKLRSSKTRAAARSALLRLLPRMKASDTNLLDAEQRGILHTILWHGTTNAENRLDGELVLAILKAFEQVGDSRAIWYVERWTRFDASSFPKLAPEALSAMIREAAHDCLIAIRARIAQDICRNTLLIPANAPDSASEILLRPAAGTGKVDSSMLLRASDLSESSKRDLHDATDLFLTGESIPDPEWVYSREPVKSVIIIEPVQRRRKRLYRAALSIALTPLILLITWNLLHPRLNSDLLDAIFRGDLAAAQFLLNRGGDPNALDGTGRYQGRTALTLASEEGFAAGVKVLLDRGANVNALDGMHGTALCWAVGGQEAVESQRIETVRILLDRGADVYARDGIEMTALLDAVSIQGDRPQLVKSLLDHGSGVNDRGSGGKTALMYAAEGGEVEIVRILLARGADVRAKDRSGRTALEFASALSDVSSKTSIVAMLKEAKVAEMGARG